MYTSNIEEDNPEYENQTPVKIKEEVQDTNTLQEYDNSMTEIEPTIICKPVEPIELPKVAIPRIHRQDKKVTEKKQKGKPVGRPRIRPILPMTQKNQPECPSIPSPQIPNVTYQLCLADQFNNYNNPVQYTIKPMFIQQIPTCTTSTVPVIISQPVYQINDQTPPTPKMPKIAPKPDNQVNCSYCSHPVNNINQHIHMCELNPKNKMYKFRQI